MTASKPFDLRLPTPGCHNDPERVGLDAKGVFDGMTEHLFFTLGKLASTASRHDLYMALELCRARSLDGAVFGHHRSDARETAEICGLSLR